MSLYRRGGKVWSRIMHRGNIHRRSTGVSNIKEARAIEAAWRLQIAQNAMGLSKAPTISEFSTQFLNYFPNRVKPKTYKAYVNSWTKHILPYTELSNLPMDRINGAVVNQFSKHLLDKGLSRASVNLHLGVLSVALHLAQDWGLINRVARTHKVTGENRREFVISAELEKTLIDGASGIMAKIIPFAIDTGLRAEEIARLTWDDVGDGVIKVKVGKTRNAERQVPLTKRAQTLLGSLREAAVPGVPNVFTRRKGTSPLPPNWISGRFVELKNELGIDPKCVFHSCRHTFLTRLGKAGASPFELQKLAGHGSIAMSARYCHPDTEQLTKAIERLNK